MFTSPVRAAFSADRTFLGFIALNYVRLRVHSMRRGIT
jgi:hypothetical protein